MFKHLSMAIFFATCLAVAISIFAPPETPDIDQGTTNKLHTDAQVSIIESPEKHSVEDRQQGDDSTTDIPAEITFCAGKIHEPTFEIKPAGMQKLLANPNLDELTEADILLLVAALHDIKALFKESLDPLGADSRKTLPEPYQQMSLERLMNEADAGDRTASRLVGKHLSTAALRKYTAQYAQESDSSEPPKGDFRLLNTDQGFVDGLNYLNTSCASGDNDSCFSAYFMVLFAERVVWKHRPRSQSQEWQHFRIQRFAYAKLMSAIGSPGMRLLIANDSVQSLPENETGVYPNELSETERIAVRKQAQELSQTTQRALENQQDEEKERLDWLQRWGYLEKFSAEVEIMCE